MSPGGPRPVSVCMLIWNFHPASGGAEAQCLRLSRELAGRGLKIMVLTQRLAGTARLESIDGFDIVRIGVPRWPARFIDRLFGFSPGGMERGAQGKRPSPVKIFRLVFSRLIPESIFVAGSLLNLFLLRRKFAIIHVHEGHWIAALGVFAAKLLGKKSLVKEATTGLKGSLYSLPAPLRAMAARADAYPAISRVIAANLAGCGIPEQRIRVIPNGIHLAPDRWSGGDPADPFVAFVGNLSQQPLKGIDVLIEAWSLIARKSPAVRLRLIGGGNAAPLEAQARDLGIRDRIDFLGARRDVQDHLLRCRVFVLPSRIEGMSNALLEAMALGIPCVATDISGSQDLIRSGVSGVLVPSEDPKALGEAIQELLEDPGAAAKMGGEARAAISELCDMPRVADRYQSLYRHLLGEKA